jgi:hypothetical protein
MIKAEERAVGTIIQYTHRGNDERNQRWNRVERAELFAQYEDLHAQGLSQRQAAKVLDVVESKYSNVFCPEWFQTTSRSDP